MKRNLIFFIVVLSIFFSVQLLNNSKRNEQITANLESFGISIKKLKKDPNKVNLIDARCTYKKVERYVAYYYPSIEKLINGAPVKGLIQDELIAELVEPHGLQVIEELIQSGENISKEIQILEYNTGELIKKFKNKRILGKDVLALNRYEIIRVATLGISGYENVQFSDGMKESIVSLTEIKNDLKEFKESNESIRLITKAVQMISSSDFNNLDRAKLIRNYLDPCYEELLKMYQKTGYELPSKNAMVPVNFEAKSIFSPDFLNNNYYTKFKSARVSKDQEELGKVLFFDPILSKNNKRSCASCHDPKKGFTDGVAKSKAFDEKGTVNRNSPTLINASYQSNFFWDMRSEHLEDQVHHVVLSSKEFNTNFNDLILKLRSSKEYSELFKNVYPSEEEPVNISNLKNAITSYIKSLSSFESRFDKYMRKEETKLTASEINGFNLFMGKANCGTCHFAPLFNGTVPPLYGETDGEVLGVPDNSKKKIDDDMGRQAFQMDEYKYDFLARMFKTPTVRNVSISAPYMHNGCFNTLNEVMDFYNKGGGLGQGFNIDNQTLSTKSLNLTQAEIDDVIAFMKALSDNPFEKINLPDLPKFDNKSLNKRVIGGVY